MTDEMTVFVIDDDPAARESVCALVETLGLETKAFASGEEFLQNYGPSQTGCVITDLQMPDLNGVQLQEEMRARGIRLPVIIISGYANVQVTVRAMRGGALTLLEKPYSDDDLTRAVYDALALESESRRTAGETQEARERLASLTDEERQIVDLLIAGTPNKSIAKQFDVGLRTVERRRQSIFQKMGVQTAAELARRVIELRHLERQR